MRLAREGFASLGFVGSAIDEELVGEVARRRLAIYGEKGRFGGNRSNAGNTAWRLLRTRGNALLPA